MVDIHYKILLLASSIYYAPEVSSMKYIAVWEYLGRNTSGLSLNSENRNNTLENWYSWVVKIRNTSEYSGHNTPIDHITDRNPMGLGQYDNLEEYCDPHTASSVFLILFSLTLFFMSRDRTSSLQGSGSLM